MSTMNNELEMRFRSMMTRIGQVMNDDELKNMKFFCKKWVPEKVQQKIKHPTDLWAELENRGMIGPGSLAFLKELLRNCMHGRTDCLEMVNEFESQVSGGVTSSSSSSSTVQLGVPSSFTSRRGSSSYRGPDLRREVVFLTKNLGHDWKFFMRALGLSEPDLDLVVEGLPGNVREQIQKALGIWLHDMQDMASKERLMDALREVGRKDLAHKLKKDSY